MESLFILVLPQFFRDFHECPIGILYIPDNLLCDTVKAQIQEPSFFSGKPSLVLVLQV